MTNMPLDDFQTFILSMEKPFWEPIGRYIFNFGLLEKKVDDALTQLMDVSHDVGAFSLRPIQSMVAKINLIEALTRLHTKADASLRTKMEEIISEIGRQNSFRNDLVHGPWTAHITNFEGGENAWQKFKISANYKPRGFNV